MTEISNVQGSRGLERTRLFCDHEATYLLVRDVAERRRVRELDQLKTNFLNKVSHELRTPLTSAKWSTESLAELLSSEENPNVEKLLGIIRDDNQRLTDLIEQLLSFSKLDAGELKPHIHPTPIASILEDVLVALAPIAEQKRIRLETSVPLPDAVLMAYQVRKVLVNILDNAIKYTQESGSVDQSWRLDGNHLGLEVSDTGIGIPESDMPHLFEKFSEQTSPMPGRRGERVWPT